MCDLYEMFDGIWSVYVSIMITYSSLYLQCGAVITRYNMSLHYTQYCNDSSKTSFRLEKTDRVITASHYSWGCFNIGHPSETHLKMKSHEKSFAHDLLLELCSVQKKYTWWRHQMEKFTGNWPFVRGIHRSRWIPHTNASDAELWCFVLSASE